MDGCSEAEAREQITTVEISVIKMHEKSRYVFPHIKDACNNSKGGSMKSN